MLLWSSKRAPLNNEFTCDKTRKDERKKRRRETEDKQSSRWWSPSKKTQERNTNCFLGWVAVLLVFILLKISLFKTKYVGGPDTHWWQVTNQELQLFQFLTSEVIFLVQINTCPLTIYLITFPKLVKLKLTRDPSLSLSPSEPEGFCLSLPAKSTKLILDCLVRPRLGNACGETTGHKVGTVAGRTWNPSSLHFIHLN